MERNRGRLEARCVVRFDITAEQACFPFAAQAARLTRCVERPDAKEGIQTEWFITSCGRESFDAQAIYEADRRHWGIENGLHLRLDVTAGEDTSRVRLPKAALNLAMIRRATLSVAIHWIRACPSKRQATLRGFYDFMAARNARKAFSLVTASNPSWLPP